MYQVQKRDGKNVEFDLSKISQAVKMAFEAQEKQYNQSIIDFIALKVTADFEPKIKEGLISVEDIQDSVESVLVQAGYGDVAKAYILYRRQHEKLRNAKSTILDFKKAVDDYVKINDWRVKESVEMLKSGPVEFEFRTTVVSPLHTPDDFEDIGRWIAGAKHYYLQNFVDSGDILEPDGHFSAVSREALNEMLARVKPFVPGAALRGK